MACCQHFFFLYPEPSVLVAFNVIGRGTLFDPRAFVTCLLGVEGGLIYQKVIFFPKGEKEHRLFLSVKCSEIQFWIVEWGYIIFLRNLTVPRNRRFLLLRQFYPFIPFRCRMLSPTSRSNRISYIFFYFFIRFQNGPVYAIQYAWRALEFHLYESFNVRSNIFQV